MSITLQDLKERGDAPIWLTDAGYTTLQGGYLLPNETPRGMWERISKRAAVLLERPDLEARFFKLFWKRWLGASTPILTNFGTDRGLPISCFSSYCPDSIDGIFDTFREIAGMSSQGGGTAINFSGIRPAGAPIHGGGVSNGVVPWTKIMNEIILRVTQGRIRRGSTAAYLDIEHGDYPNWLKVRKATNVYDQHCPYIHQGSVISDYFMKQVMDGDEQARKLWLDTLDTRLQTGEPYLLFIDNVNRANPPWYKDKGLKVNQSNLCLLADELVVTKEGNRRIADLVGKTVDIWDGSNWTSVDTFRSYGFTNQLVEVTYSDGSSIKTTVNHRFPLANGTVVEAQDLKAGQVVETHSVEAHGSKEIAGAYLKGFLVGDGTQKNGRPILPLYSTKYNCQERLLGSASELTDGNAGKTALLELGFTKEDSSKRKYIQGLSQFKDQLIDWCTEYRKALPDDIWEWNLISKLEFIAGVMDADGCALDSGRSKGYQICSVNKQWLLDFQKLLNGIGVQSCVGLLRKAQSRDFGGGYGEYQCQAVYRLTVSSIGAYKLAELCQFSRLKKVKPNSTKKSYNCKPRHGIIKSVELLDVELTEVFCCKVESTGLFALADGRMTGNCSEMSQFTDEDHSLVCCLASLNLAVYDEWQHTDAIELSIYFLDAVITEFLNKAKNLPGFERAVRCCEKARALGLGVLGYHTMLQQRSIPFASKDAYKLNKSIWRHIKNRAEKATRQLAQTYGEPEWCKGHGVRNTHLLAVAPTVTNTIICGGNVSASVEPITANLFLKQTAKTTIPVYNEELQKVLRAYGKDTDETRESILDANGSVQNLDFLSDHEKEVFKTAREIKQIHVVRQACERQPHICQAQSINLFWSKDYDSQEFNLVHLAAWQGGLKSLYYCRTEAPIEAAKTTVLKAPAPSVCSLTPKYNDLGECIPCSA